MTVRERRIKIPFVVARTAVGELLDRVIVQGNRGDKPRLIAVSARTGGQARLTDRPDASRLRSRLALAKWACLRLGSAIGAA